MAGDTQGRTWRGWARLSGMLVDSQTPWSDQDGSGRARSRARALLNWFCQGQPWGRCKVRRRALRVSRPAREKKRRRRVLVVATGSPSPMRVVQRAKLWAMIWMASQAALVDLRHCRSKVLPATEPGQGRGG